MAVVLPGIRIDLSSVLSLLAAGIGSGFASGFFETLEENKLWITLSKLAT
jgi:hypothetical protein